MRKWRLLLTTLPFPLALLGARFTLQAIGFSGIVDFADVGMVLTGGIFLVGFMLAGTMSDFKESERLPGEVACCLETIEETFAQAAAGKPAIDGVRLRRTVLEAVEGILAWLHTRAGTPGVYAELDRLRDAAQELEKSGAGPYAGRSLNELHALRRHVTRIQVISRTGFLSSGYALLETLTAAILGLLLVARFKNVLSEITLVTFVTVIYVYMLRLIRDVDDPFEYSSSGGAAEVELFPIIELRDRLRARLEPAAVETKAAAGGTAA